MAKIEHEGFTPGPWELTAAEFANRIIAMESERYDLRSQLKAAEAEIAELLKQSIVWKRTAEKLAYRYIDTGDVDDAEDIKICTRVCNRTYEQALAEWQQVHPEDK